MTRKLLTVLLLSCAMAASYAQIPNNVYSDAQTLLKAVKPDTIDSTTWQKVLKRYVPPADTNKLTSLEDFQKYFKDNPFAFVNVLSATKEEKTSAQAIVENQTSSTNITGALSAPVVAGALTQVIIQRGKEELTVAFFDRFKAELKKYPCLDSLFPKSEEFLMNIETYLYAGSLNTIRQAFSDDISNLPVHIPAFLHDPAVINFIGNNPKFANVAALVPGLSYAGKLLSGGSVPDAIKAFYPLDKVKGVDNNLYQLLQIVPILSESIRDPNAVANWITPQDFNTQVLAVGGLKTIFFGLLYEELKNIEFSGDAGAKFSFKKLLTPGNEKAAAEAIQSVIQEYKDVQAAVASIQVLKRNADTPSFNSVVDLLTKAVQDMKSAYLVVNKILKFTATTDNRIEQLFQLLPQVNAIVKAVYSREYSAAAVNGFLLITEIIGNDGTVSPKVLKYVSFMAAVAEAKTSNDIAAALDAAILPVGSSSIKSNTNVSVAINSYIGAGYYTEHYHGPSGSGISTSLPTFGVSLPIGVSLSKGLRNKWVGSVSLFASILDLGAIASFKLSNPDSVNSKPLPDFTWQNILAPGAYITFGRLFNSPLAIGVGFQKGPQLRSITYTQHGGAVVDLSQGETYRFGAFLSVDIPLFNLFSSPYPRPLNTSK